MPGFRLTKPYTMPADEVRSAAQGLAQNLQRQHKVSVQWQGEDQVSIKGSGVSGRMSIHDQMIDISVKLGFPASMFESVLKQEVQRYLDEHVS